MTCGYSQTTSHVPKHNELFTNYFLVPKHKEFLQTTSSFPNTKKWTQTTSLFPDARNYHKLLPCSQTQGILTNNFLVSKHNELYYHKLRSCFQNTRNNSQPSPQFPIHGRCHTTWRTRQKPPKFAWLLAW